MLLFFFSGQPSLIQILVLRVVQEDQHFKGGFSELVVGFLELTLYSDEI